MIKTAMFALTLTACAGSVRPVVLECHNNYPDIRDIVYEDWLEVGVETPYCYSLEYLEKSELIEACDGHISDGCSFRLSQRVYVRADLSEERQMVVMYHEVGHLAAVNEGHLECDSRPGDDIMCPSGASNGTVPTERDAAFVKGLLSQ